MLELGCQRTFSRNAAFTDIRRDVAGDDPRHLRAMIRAQHAMPYTDYWRDAQDVFHVESATTPGVVYHVDITGACLYPSNDACKHQYMERIGRHSRSHAAKPGRMCGSRMCSSIMWCRWRVVSPMIPRIYNPCVGVKCATVKRTSRAMVGGARGG